MPAVLLDLGLILDRSHGSGARRGYRTKDGQIAQASGFDLSPFAARMDEFVSIYEKGRAADRRRKDLLIRRTQALRGIGQMVRTAGEGGFDSDALYSLADRRDVITLPTDRRAMKRDYARWCRISKPCTTKSPISSMSLLRVGRPLPNRRTLP